MSIFRIWDKKYSEMLPRPNDVDTLAISQSGDGYLIFGRFNRRAESFSGDAIIMMSSGLTDRNGVEVFEGDILTSDLVGARSEVVVIKNGAFYLTEPSERTLFDELASHNGFRVIGNIYENPDLLKN